MIGMPNEIVNLFHPRVMDFRRLQSLPLSAYLIGLFISYRCSATTILSHDPRTTIPLAVEADTNE
jgi:hypothetical protein